MKLTDLIQKQDYCGELIKVENRTYKFEHTIDGKVVEGAYVGFRVHVNGLVDLWISTRDSVQVIYADEKQWVLVDAFK